MQSNERRLHFRSMANLLRTARSTHPFHQAWAASLAIVLTAAGCATVAKVSNLSEESCRTSFTRQLSAILTHEGEKSEAAEALASKTVSSLTT